MGYFQDYQGGYASSHDLERMAMEVAGFDPGSAEDRRIWRKCKFCGECSTCNPNRNKESQQKEKKNG